MDELSIGPRVLREDLALIDEVNLNVELFQGDGIAEVSIESIRLLHQQGSAGMVLLEPPHHLIERFSASFLGGIYVFESLNDGHVTVVSIDAQSFGLSTEGEPFLFLFSA